MRNSLKPSFYWSLILMAGCTQAPSYLPAPEGAIGVAQAATQSQRTFESLTELGLYYSSHERHDEALKMFQQSLAVNPKSARAYNNICFEYNVLKQWNFGIENCQKALTLEPDFVLAGNNLAYGWRFKGFFEHRVVELERNIKAGLDSDKNRLNLGLEFYLQREYERAVEAWLPISERSEDFAIAQNDLASVYILLKKYDLAKACLSRALERDPKNILYLNNQRWLQLMFQKYAL